MGYKASGNCANAASRSSDVSALDDDIRGGGKEVVSGCFAEREIHSQIKIC
jgi:hypothetical protein